MKVSLAYSDEVKAEESHASTERIFTTHLFGEDIVPEMSK